MARTANQLACCVVLSAFTLISCSKPAPPRASDSEATASASADSQAVAGTSGYLTQAPDTPYQDIHGTEGCAGDCSGLDAGYRWAAERDISEESKCSGSSESFVKGCEVYVQDHPESRGQDRH